MDEAPVYTIMGIDPGLAFTGFAIAQVEGRSSAIRSVQAIGLIESNVDHKVSKTEDRFLRAGSFNAQLQWVAAEFSVDAIACEMPFFAAHRYINFAAGMMIGAIAALDLPTLLVWPKQIKAAAARASAPKRDVVAWAIELTKPHGVPWPTSVVPNGMCLEFEGAQVAAYAEHPADALAAIQAGIRTPQWLTAPDRPPESAPRYEQS